MIPVTRTFLPPITEYNTYLKKIWQTNWIANRGTLVLELEEKLRDYLNVSSILATANATIALQIAINSIGKSGEIITTPFSYIATSSSIIWQKCTAVFVDIDRDYLTIDENLIESKINSNTVAILATHVFGNPCNVEVLDHIAKKYNLMVIYDAAHCFGVKYKGESIFNRGDISVCSFHGTKLFHTGEGGAIFCSDKKLFKLLFDMHNFGHDGLYEFIGLGINGKMSELQAAMGLAVLPYVDELIRSRKIIHEIYDNVLSGNEIKKLKIRNNTSWNYSYYPVVFESEVVLSRVIKKLNNSNIFPRRYFFPALNTIPFISNQVMPVAESTANRILCLPLFNELSHDDVGFISELIKNVVK